MTCLFILRNRNFTCHLSWRYQSKGATAPTNSLMDTERMTFPEIEPFSSQKEKSSRKLAVKPAKNQQTGLVFFKKDFMASPLVDISLVVFLDISNCGVLFLLKQHNMLKRTLLTCRFF